MDSPERPATTATIDTSHDILGFWLAGRRRWFPLIQLAVFCIGDVASSLAFGSFVEAPSFLVLGIGVTAFMVLLLSLIARLRGASSAASSMRAAYVYCPMFLVYVVVAGFVNRPTTFHIDSPQYEVATTTLAQKYDVGNLQSVKWVDSGGPDWLVRQVRYNTTTQSCVADYHFAGSPPLVVLSDQPSCH